MEWKWVKSLLIILFLLLDCFLGYQVYQRNTVSVMNPATVESIKDILETQNITCNFDLADIELKKYMQKINISSEKNIEEAFVPISSIQSQEIKYTGRRREIISVQAIIANFIRETKLSDVTISSITLGYYPEINQIDTNILYGEATPAWNIVLENGEEYTYNAYIGNRIERN